ncbi:MAG: CYTH and CHAD domain-containing protein [Thiobacillus sp.]|nr:CYTH and CHAD domain-containing protein [Thiobacillus sp.]
MTASDSVEIELKLALPPQQVEAFLKLMARRRGTPVRQVLVTRYFDTPDFALSAQGVALRVRRIGRRWLQTLKTEGERRGGLSHRAEYEMAVTRGSPDWTRFSAEALAYVPQDLRAQLAPVFEMRFKRTAWLIKGRGGARIEVALDVGEVRTLKGINAGERSQPICEIELELKAGQPDALFALALAWAGRLDCLPFDISKAERGVRLAHGESAEPVKSVPLALDRAMSVEDGFAAIVQACLAQFQANLPEVLASDDIEYVHQARVALRRLRAALRQYRRVCVPPDELMDGLRALAAALGAARDWDVLCDETLPAIAPHYPDADAWQHGMQVLQAHRVEVRAAMRAALIQARPGAWLLALQRWLLLRGWRAVPEAQRFIQLSPLKKWAGRALQKGHRPIVRGARDFGQLQAAQRHALRIAVKRQRYAAEFFQTLFGGRRQDRYLAVLRDAQNSLGRSNDARVAWGLLTTAHTTPRVLQNVVDRSPLGHTIPRVLQNAGPMRDFVLGWLAAKQADAADGESAGPMRAFLKWKPYW